MEAELTKVLTVTFCATKKFNNAANKNQSDKKRRVDRRGAALSLSMHHQAGST